MKHNLHKPVRRLYHWLQLGMRTGVEFMGLLGLELLTNTKRLRWIHRGTIDRGEC